MAYNAGVENFLLSIDKEWYDKLKSLFIHSAYAMFPE